MIPKGFLADLAARTDLVALIGHRVELKRAGAEWTGRCPFHDEKSPSFFVSPRKGFAHCFGCGWHGDAVAFLMEHDRLEFRDAVDVLARAAGVQVPDDEAAAARADATRPLLAALECAAVLFRRWLTEHPARESAQAYLARRGIDPDTAERFQIGFAPGNNALLAALGSGEHGPHLLPAGLLAEQGGRRYDRFRDRLMLPIRDPRGRVIGFGGRILGDSKPKYLNSPETPVFHKGGILYGLHEALAAERRPARVVVVEGHLDVVALHQAGLPAAVATQGTALTAEHLAHLLRVAPEIVFCFDGDRAGRAAAWKALLASLPHAGGQTAFRFLSLPDGEDADSLVRAKGADAFRARIDAAPLLSEALFTRLTDTHDPTTPEGAAALDASARPLLDAVPPGTYRARLEQRLAALTGVEATHPAPPRPGRGTRARPAAQAPQTTPARLALALLLADVRLAEHARQAHPDWRDAPSPAVPLLEELLEMAATIPGLTGELAIERWRGTPEAATLARLADLGRRPPLSPEDRPAELTRALAALGRGTERAA